MKKQLLLFILMLLPMIACADAVEINGIYYNLDSQTKTAEVTSNPNRYRGDIVIPNSVIYEENTYSTAAIGKSAFNLCSRLTSVTIPTSVTSIGERAFYICSDLISVNIPNSVTSIGSYAFFECRSLTSITIPNSITSISDYTFEGCRGLTSITIPNSVTSIGSSAFAACSGLTSITIPNSVTSIVSYAFEGCSGLTSITIPNSVASIDMFAFSGCSGLTSITIPNSVTSIGTSAFSGCSGLTSIIIPDGVTRINSEVFQNCSGLTSITIPDGVTRINSEAFDGCKVLSSITIGTGLTLIGKNAFSNCPELTTFYCYAEQVPYTSENVFYGSNIEKASLYVPKSSVESYKAAEPWKNFKEIVKISMPEHTLTYKVDDQVYKTYTIEEGETITPEPAPTKEGYTFSGWSDIPQTMPDHDVTVTGSFAINKYKLTYEVDGSVYKTYDIEYGASITPEPAPTREGYTFSGWNNLPQTMPARDVTVTGTFSVNKYKLTYMVDGNVYKTYDIEYGATITPEAVPTKDGYTFSGWSSIPATMPANDVTVTGTFSKGSYKLTYMVDGTVYKTVTYEYGARITPEAAPTKEGHTFSGWSEVPETMPAYDVTVTGSFTINKYKLTYIINGTTYKEYEIEYGSAITPETAPDWEGHTFSGWSELPKTMPAEDVIVTGTYTINHYTLTYLIDGEEYKSYEIEYGASITPEAEPKKEGYAFSGWSAIPRTMPAHDVTVTGTFTKGAYKLIYMVDGEVYKTVSYDYGETITPEAEPTKEGYTFSGWSNIPTTMPAQDVTVTGSFTINKYKLIYKVDGEVYKSYDVEYGATITPEAEPTKEGYKFSGWSYIPSKMPAEDVTVVGTFTQEAAIKDNVSYGIVGSNASVTHADNAKGEVKIEESVEINGRTYQVTAIADGAFQGCKGLTSVEIPNTVITIGKNAFDGCSGLIVIKIGKGIKEIGSKAFANIGNSKARTRAEDAVLKVYCEAEVLPSTAADAFENTPIDKATLYVADGLVDVCKLVMPWNGFGTIVGLSTGIRSVTIDSEDAMIFDMQGNRLDNIRKGVNIIRTRDGKTKKMMVK